MGRPTRCIGRRLGPWRQRGPPGQRWQSGYRRRRRGRGRRRGWRRGWRRSTVHGDTDQRAANGQRFGDLFTVWIWSLHGKNHNAHDQKSRDQQQDALTNPVAVSGRSASSTHGFGNIGLDYDNLCICVRVERYTVLALVSLSLKPLSKRYLLRGAHGATGRRHSLAQGHAWCLSL